MKRLTDKEKAQILAMNARGVAGSHIAKLLGRRSSTIFTFFNPRKMAVDETSPRPSERLWAERDARINAPVRNLTALVCGDPREGYSALERRA